MDIKPAGYRPTDSGSISYIFESDESIVEKIKKLQAKRNEIQATVDALLTKDHPELTDRKVITEAMEKIDRLEFKIHRIYQKRLDKTLASPTLAPEIFTLVSTLIQQRGPLTFTIEGLPLQFHASYENGTVCLQDQRSNLKLNLQSDGMEGNDYLKNFGGFFLFVALTGLDIKSRLPHEFETPLIFEYSEKMYCAWFSTQAQKIQVQAGADYEQGSEAEKFGLDIEQYKDGILIRRPAKQDLTRINQGLQLFYALYKTCRSG